MRYYDRNLPVTVQADASLRGLGACLIQQHKGKEQPIAFASKSLTDTETRYANIERELLAIVFACQHFSTYLLGRSFVAESDHKPLEMIAMKNIANAPPRLQRMLLELQRYDVTIKYPPGKEMQLADALSRCQARASQEIKLDMRVDYIAFMKPWIEKLKDSTQRDPILATVYQLTQQGWLHQRRHVPRLARRYADFRDELSTDDGMLLKGPRLIIPGELQEEYLSRLHEGHLSASKVQENAKQHMYWTGIDVDIEDYTKRCQECIKRSQVPKEPLQPHDIPEGPWRKLGIDYFAFDGNSYVLICDYFSKFPFLYRAKTSFWSLRDRLIDLFSIEGYPDEIKLDMRVDYIAFTKPWIEKLKDSTQRDPILATVYQLTQQGWPHQRRHVPHLARRYWDFRDELSTDDGMLLKGPRLIIPGELQEEYLSRLHKGHLSASKVQENAKQHMYWTGIDADIEDYTKRCQQCIKRSQVPKEPLQPHDIPEGPWRKLGIDYFAFDGNSYVLICDYFSKFPFLYRAKTSFWSLRDRLNDLFSIEGYPDEIKLDMRVDYIAFTKPWIEKLKDSTQRDPILATVYQLTQQGWPHQRRHIPHLVRRYWDFRDELSTDDGMLLHKGHLSASKVQENAKQHMYWTGIDADIEDYTKRCQKCIKRSQVPKEPLQPHDIPEGPWRKLGIDYFAFDGNSYVLIYGYFSKFPFLYRAKTSFWSLRDHLIDLFSIEGYPDEIVSDNGPPFHSKEFAKFLSGLGIKHTTSSPGYPRSNGFIERHIQTVKNMLSKSSNTRSFQEVLADLRTTRIGTGLPSPAEILHGRNLTTRAQAEIDIKAIRSVLQERQLKMMLDHDMSRRAKKARPLVVGERCHVLGPGNKWIDAFITGITDSGRSYETQVEAMGKQLTRNCSHIRPRSPDIPHMHASFLQ